MSANLASPLTDWTVLGTATGNSSGSFQYTVPAMTNDPQKFFIITLP
jgi:hypothetical protein